LSKALKTDVLGFLVHGSDVAMYWLYRSGELMEEFNSNPNWGGAQVDEETRARVRGNADALLPLCRDGITRADVDAVLHPAGRHPLFAETIVNDLAKLLGIDDARASLGFNYFEREGRKVFADAAEFEAIGKGSERKGAYADGSGVRQSRKPDTFPRAIDSLTHGWKKRYVEQMIALAAARSPGGNREHVLKIMKEVYDGGAAELLKRSVIDNVPTIEELKAARDRGPDALAALIAARAPEQLMAVGVYAVNSHLDDFLAALFEHGLDPNETDRHGWTIVKYTERYGSDSKTYQVAKAAADKRK